MDFTQRRIVLRAPRWAVLPSAKEGARRHGDSDWRRSSQGAERRRVEYDEQGELVGQETFAANRKGLRTLQRSAKRLPERRWAVEVAGGIGRLVAVVVVRVQVQGSGASRYRRARPGG